MRWLAGSLARTALGAGAVLAASLGGAALVGAVGPGAEQSAIVHGCYAKKDGTLRIVDPGVGCQNDVALDWPRGGFDGPVGATGAAGPSGAPGPGGPAGAPGADGRPLAVERISGTSTGTGRQTAQAQCPSGRYAVSGGWTGGATDAVSILESGPTAGSRGWRVVADHLRRATLTVTVLCTSASDPPAEPTVPPAGSPRDGCAVACLPSRMTLSEAVTSGVPVVVAKRQSGATVSVALRSAGHVVGRALRRSAGAGAVKVEVPLTAPGARRLARRRQAVLTARITVGVGKRAPVVVTRRLTVRR